MFVEFFEKFKTFKSHHQLTVALIVALCIICLTWGIEQILERHLSFNKSFLRLLGLVAISLFILWIVKHVVIHTM